MERSYADTHHIHRTAAELIEHTLTLEILRGERRAESRLPSVRALAEQFDTTVPTIQRVIDRLAALDLVEAKRGSGVTVRDPLACGGLSLYPMWLIALQDQPTRAGQYLADFLEIRRLILVHLLTRHREALLETLPQWAAELPMLTGDDATLDSRLEADLRVSRGVLGTANNHALNAINHSIERMVRVAPWVAESFYGDARGYREILGGVGAALFAGAPPETLITVIEQWDNVVLSTYIQHLERAIR